MHAIAILISLAVRSMATTASTAAPEAFGSGMASNVTDSDWTSVQCAEAISGIPWNDTSVQWMDCDELARQQEDRAAHCEPGGCPLPCNIKTTTKVILNGKGTWWTRWCHAGGLHTSNKGSFAYIGTGHSTSVTFSGDISAGGEIGKYVGATFGFSISKTKSVNSGVGCVNFDGQPHGVWLQEQMGWMDTTVVTTITETGGSW